MTDISLLEALGSPSLELLPPTAASAEWTARRNRLRAHLRAAGCHAHLRTPAALWAAAGAQGRPGRLWTQLSGTSLATLTARLLRPLGTVSTFRRKRIITISGSQKKRRHVCIRQ